LAWFSAQIRRRSIPKSASGKKTTKIRRTGSNNDIPKIIDKNDPRYIRLSALSRRAKAPWYQKFVRLNNEDKKSVYIGSRFCVKCKLERLMYTNRAMNLAAYPDQVGECGVCGTL
jgi:hypothetical protein